MKRIAIFASGSGSNAENIIRYFREKDNAVKFQVLTNNPKAKVLERCKNLEVSAFSFNRTSFFKTDDVVDHLRSFAPDLIVLAGFLWKIPENIIAYFPEKIINVHPALLPKFGGKGMYGMHVHKAVIANRELKSGITIHYVNEHYDEGASIFQAECTIEKTDSAEDLAQKIDRLEMQHFPQVVEKLLMNKHSSKF